MMLVKHNPNETAYVGAKKHFRDVIKNTGPLDALIYREPEEDFNTHSTLIVDPGETAVFVHNGMIEDVIEGGRTPIKTENLPFVSRLRTAFTGGISSFNCYVIFIRTTSTRQIDWGDRIQVRDPVQSIQTDLGINGTYRVRVKDPEALINQLLGSRIDTIMEDSLQDYFSGEMIKHIKSNIVKAINNSDSEILGIEANLDAFSDELFGILKQVFEKYGISLENFSIAKMTIMDSETRNQLEKMYAQKRGMDYMGPEWGRNKIAEIMMEIAKNPGSGGIASTGAGLGMGMAAMPFASAMFQQIAPGTTSMVEAMMASSRNEDTAHADHAIPKEIKGSYRQKSESAPLPADSSINGVLCLSCGKMNEAGSNYCSGCGAAISEHLTCPSCGKEMPKGSLFCSSCGKKL